MQLDANASWFNFTAQGGDFSVYAFSGREEVCKPYEFSIELVSRSSNVDITGLLGTPACLSIADQSGDKRLVHGLIREMEQLHTANVFTHYRCVLVPRLWFLSQIHDHRIFQNLSVVQIIQQILQEQGFTGEASAFKLSFSYEPREYCVQYGETDLHFITRLCEEEGIYFYFEHKEDSHCLCFCDREGGPKISGESDLRFYPGSGHASDTAVISRLNLHHRVNSNASTYREWNFERPKLNLEVKKQEPDKTAAPTPPGMLLEQYQYPHLYQLQKPGTTYAELQLLRQLTFRQWIECASDVSRYLPSYTFTVHDHPRKDINAGWWIVAVRHEGEQPGVLEHEAPSERGLRYNSFVTAIPEMTRFIPELEHPKNRVIGDQTAIVTGPDGEEIFPDKHGRVKVQFFWDREGQWDDKTTCWIRASQGWAGSQYGMMAIPRIGHEVIVSFLEGNPDRPLITGRVYHELNKPPYELPAHKTRTVFKSMSTPGEEGQPRGFNEFRIEDKKGEEEIYVHGEKDVNIYVKNDWKEHILHDRHQTVDNFTYTKTEGETHETLKGQRKTELFANDNLTVHADSHTKVDGKWLGKAGTEFHIKAGEKIVIEAGSEITIRGGAGWIKLDPSGVRMGGPKINLGGGGSPGSGSGAKPEAPEEAIGVDESGKPVQSERRKAEKKPGDPVVGAGGTGSGKSALPNVTPATPTDTPQEVDLSNMQGTFSELWGKSFPAGKSQEFGGTIVKDASTGEYSVINTRGGTGGTFTADLAVPKDKEVVGVFHTHPYDKSEGGYSGISFSGADIANSLNNPERKIAVVQSGDKQFMLMRTSETKTADYDTLSKSVNNRIKELLTGGKEFPEAVSTAAKETAKANGLSYYEGVGGKFTKIH